MNRHLKRTLAAALAAMLLTSTLTNITGLYAAGQDPVSRIYSAVTGNPRTSEEYAERAGEKITQGDYAGALGDYEKARSLTDDAGTLSTLWLRTASVCVITGDDSGARSATDAALEANPSCAQGMLLSAQLYLADGDADSAATAMEAYVVLMPEDTANRAALAQIYEDAGRYTQAAEIYEALFEKEPTEVDYQTGAMRCRFEAGEFQTLVAFAEKTDKTALQAQAHQVLGIALVQLGRSAEAVDELTQAIGLSGSHYYRGEALLALERYGEAEADFTQAIEENSLADYAYYNRGVCRVHMGEYETAMDDFDVVLTGDNEELIDMATDALMQTAGR